MSGLRNPEIQRLLASLNGYSGSEQNTGPSPAVPHSDNYNEFKQSPATEDIISSTPAFGTLTSKATSDFERSYSLPEASGGSTSRSFTPVSPDVSSINTWPAALKHVTKYVATNEDLSRRISNLIAEQHKHEKQWWAGREALIERQNSRIGKSQQVAALLKSLGGKDIPVTQNDSNLNQAELDAYDKKVYLGLMQMAADFDRKLKILGIPFYAIRHDLVIPEEGKENSDAQHGRLDRGELRVLQKRMLQTLEDLFGD